VNVKAGPNPVDLTEIPGSEGGIAIRIDVNDRPLDAADQIENLRTRNGQGKIISLIAACKEAYGPCLTDLIGVKGSEVDGL
jgi:hypothetical protein